jgi:integrase
MPYPNDKFTEKGVKGLPLPPAVAKSKRYSTAVEFVGGGEIRNPSSAEPRDAGANGKDRRPPLQIDYFDPEQDPPGFGVRVSHKGARTWVFMYRYNGVKRRMKLGIVGKLGLRAARDLARDVAEAVRKGRDPASESKAARVRVETLKELAAAYIAEYAKPKKRSWKKDEQILDREVIPFIGRKRVVDVTRQDIREDVLRRIVARGAPVRANHTLEIVRKMFNWAIQEKDLVSANPAALLQKPGGDTGERSRYLSASEFKRFWAALDPETLGETGAVAFKLLTLTGQREMELIRARWADIDWDDRIWTIPAYNAKNRREHVIPLSRCALGLLRHLRAAARPTDEFIFQSRQTDSHMRRVFIEKRIIKIRKAARLDDFRVHDLRRSATTYWGKLNIDPQLKKRLLNHSRRADVTAIYDRFEYLDQKRGALTKWEELLLGMVGDTGSPDDGPNIARLVRAPR